MRGQMDITTLQPIFAVGALFGSIYAGYDLARTGATWPRQPLRTLATVWLVVALGLTAVEYLLFGNNVVMLIARQFNIPMHTVQIALLGSIILSVFVWSRE